MARRASRVFGVGKAIPALILSGAVVTAGCADRRGAEVRALRPPTETVRAGLTVLALQPGYDRDARLIDEPWRKSRSVGKGALTGAVAPIVVGGEMSIASAGTDYGAFTALGILLAPIGAVAGAVAGPIVAKPDAEVKGYREKIEATFAGIDPATPIARTFADRARTSARVAATVGGTGAVPHLELTVVAFGLRSGGGVDPPMQAFVVLRGRLREGADRTVVHELLWAEAGEARLFKEWSEVAASEMRGEFARLASRLAERAEEEMLELVVVP